MSSLQEDEMFGFPSSVMDADLFRIGPLDCWESYEYDDDLLDILSNGVQAPAPDPELFYNHDVITCEQNITHGDNVPKIYASSAGRVTVDPIENSTKAGLEDTTPTAGLPSENEGHAHELESSSEVVENDFNGLNDNLATPDDGKSWMNATPAIGSVDSDDFDWNQHVEESEMPDLSFLDDLNKQLDDLNRAAKPLQMEKNSSEVPPHPNDVVEEVHTSEEAKGNWRLPDQSTLCRKRHISESECDESTEPASIPKRHRPDNDLMLRHRPSVRDSFDQIPRHDQKKSIPDNRWVKKLQRVLGLDCKENGHKEGVEVFSSQSSNPGRQQYGQKQNVVSGLGGHPVPSRHQPIWKEVIMPRKKRKAEGDSEISRPVKKINIVPAEKRVRSFTNHPAATVPIPAGLSDEEIIRDYPNHLYGPRILGLYQRGWTQRMMSELILGDFTHETKKEHQMTTNKLLKRIEAAMKSAGIDPKSALKGTCDRSEEYKAKRKIQDENKKAATKIKKTQAAAQPKLNSASMPGSAQSPFASLGTVPLYLPTPPDTTASLTKYPHDIQDYSNIDPSLVDATLQGPIHDTQNLSNPFM